MANVAVCVLGSFGYDRAAQGAIGAGRALAASVGGELHVLVIGPGQRTTRLRRWRPLLTAS